MNDAEVSARSDRAATDTLPPAWDKENTIAMFEPKDKSRKHRAWEREQRIGSKHKGKGRIVWKRHETRAQQKSPVEPLVTTESSPQKVVKKVCVTREGVAQTPKHKRLGVAATWDRRLSDRLHKNRSIRITSPIKVRRDPVSKDVITAEREKNHDLLNGSFREISNDNRTPGPITQPAASPINPVDTETEAESEPTTNPTEATVPDIEPILNAEDEAHRNNFLGVEVEVVEGSKLSSQQAVLEGATETLGPLPPAPNLSLVAQANDHHVNTSEDLELSQYSEPKQSLNTDTYTVSDNQAQLLIEQDHSIDADETNSQEDPVSEHYHDEPPELAAMKRETPQALDTINPVQYTLAASATENDGQSPGTSSSPLVTHDVFNEDSATGEQAMPLSPELEFAGEDEDQELLRQEQSDEETPADDDTCMEIQAPDDNESDDESSEARIGSPGRTGPVETPDIASQEDNDELDADNWDTEEKPVERLIDDDMFANMDDAIAKVNAQGKSTTQEQSATTFHWQPSEEQYTEQVTDVVEETTTVTVQLNDNDDTEMLRDFLNRSRASKAARIAKRSSLNNKRDSDAVKLALASPRKPLEEEADPNPDSPFMQEEPRANMTSPNKPKSKDETTQDLGPADELSGSPPPPTSRRSARNRESRSTPSSITIRRPDGSEPFLLKKSEAQELSLATRSNTRRNKGGAISAKLMLMRLRGLTPEAVPEGERETSIKWNEQLVRYFDESGHRQHAEEKASDDEETAEAASKPRVRRKRALGAVNGTPAKPKHAEDDISAADGTTASQPASNTRLPEVDSHERQAKTQTQQDKAGSLPPSKRKRGIPTPTSRVPKPASQVRPPSQSQLNAYQTQASPPGPDLSTSDAERSNAIIPMESNTFADGGANAQGQTGPVPTLGSVTAPATTSSSRSARSSVTTSAIASAAASVGKRGLAGGLISSRPPGKASREGGTRGKS